MDPTILSNKIASFLKCETGGSCTLFAEWATRVFLRHGINDFEVVEGWVKAKKERQWRQHTWIEHKGAKIDPTFTQFLYLGPVKYVRRKEKRYTPIAYLELCRRFPVSKDWFKLYLRSST